VRGRPALHPDVAARVRLYALSGNLVTALRRGAISEAHAVAELALVAPGRPDLVDQEADSIERPGLPHPTEAAHAPRRALQVALLRRARRVTLGDVALVGPGGVRVTQVMAGVRGGQHYGPRLRLNRNGVEVGVYRSAEELAEHVDLATLAGEDDAEPT
jgi:hypothetical protein